jgi:hypothetical protein
MEGGYLWGDPAIGAFDGTIGLFFKGVAAFRHRASLLNYIIPSGMG